MIKHGEKSHDALLRVIAMVLEMITTASDDGQLGFEPREERADQLCSVFRGVMVVMLADTD
eukprot:6032626-Pyramimonas_sp.AAC.1